MEKHRNRRTLTKSRRKYTWKKNLGENEDVKNILGKSDDRKKNPPQLAWNSGPMKRSGVRFRGCPLMTSPHIQPFRTSRNPGHILSQ